MSGDKKDIIAEQTGDGEETGLEREEIGDGEDIGAGVETGDNPYDPNDIRVATRNVTIQLLVERLKKDGLDLAPDFDRGEVWTPRQNSRLIESILLRIPLPVFYAAEDSAGRWAVVDGARRLSTLRNFLAPDGFALADLEYLTQLAGSKFADLNRAMQRRLLETELLVHVIEPGTPQAVKFNICKRINTGGRPLNSQELRHALNPGPARDFLRTLANGKEFKQATAGDVPDDRLAACEMALRFLAFRLTDPAQYDGDALDAFLHEAMARIGTLPDDEVGNLNKEFKRSMVLAYRLFDDDAFRKRLTMEDARQPISQALFEAWSVNLADLPADDGERLIARKSQLRVAFVDRLNADSGFVKAITVSTGSRSSVRKRFAVVKDIIRGELEAQ